MVHFEVDGVQNNPVTPLIVTQGPFWAISGFAVNPVAVGVAEVQLMEADLVNASMVKVRNVSTAGQIIGCGLTGVTIATAQTLLYPGEIVELQFIGHSWYAIADAAAGAVRLYAFKA